MNTAPQKNPNVSQPQQAGTPKMSTEQAMVSMKKQIQELLQGSGITPEKLVQLGNFAFSAIKDKSLYPVFQKAAVESGIFSPTDFKPGIDFQLLSQVVIMGKVTQKMIESGQVRSAR